MKQALFFARLRSGQPDALTPSEALELATSGGARCLGRPDLGRLEVGAPADIAVWPADDIADIADPIAGLVLGPSRQVLHLLVGGDAVVTDGSLVGVDLRAAHGELARRARFVGLSSESSTAARFAVTASPRGGGGLVR